MDHAFFAHPASIVESSNIGTDTRIWAFTHVMPETRIGRDCNIGEQCFVESGVVVGDRVVIKNGVALWAGVEVCSDVFIGPNVAFTNDLRPRSKIYGAPVATRVCRGASIGANATVRCGIEIGVWAMVGAGAVVTKDVPPFALVAGNPARIREYVCRCGKTLVFSDRETSECKCGARFLRRSGIVVPMTEDER